MDFHINKRIVNFFAPCCEVSGHRFPGIFNKAGDFAKILQENGLSDHKFCGIKVLSPDSFEQLVVVNCELTGQKFDLRKNSAFALASNYRAHGKLDQKVVSAKVVSPETYQRLELAKCSKTNAIFYAKDNCYSLFETRLVAILTPKHPDCVFSTPFLSPEGYKIIEKAALEVHHRLEYWVGSVRGDLIGRHKIISTLGKVSTDHNFSEPKQVEATLKLYAAQMGGNALVNFKWEHHRNDYQEKYIAGYGHKGNPYYKTRWHREQWFTGEGTAVLVQSLSDLRTHAGGVSNNLAHDANYFATILGVSPDAPPEKIRQAYQILISKCTPKNEVATKDDEEKVAKFVAVNEAFNYLRVKYEF